MSELRQELIELRDFFTNTELPAGNLKINRYMTITDVPAYLDAEFIRVQKYSVNEGTWDREFKHLRELKTTLEARNS